MLISLLAPDALLRTLFSTVVTEIRSRGTASNPPLTPLLLLFFFQHLTLQRFGVRVHDSACLLHIEQQCLSCPTQAGSEEEEGSSLSSVGVLKIRQNRQSQRHKAQSHHVREMIRAPAIEF
eukprot:scaffold70048_cov19-Tisochrysis_lutea.AAC.1